ncbi:luciferase family protein [Nocardia spumae]|uniref:luciferase domain-containing protein n=1 Tax=Nocardia spumae TaxID=2887190 RepID=UPI001D13BC91|nr:luciferase family protein [Nocardia spumae]
MTATAPHGSLRLPQRRGERPLTRPHNPHQQLTQNPDVRLQEALWARMVTLDGTLAARSAVSLPDTRALHLRPEVAHGPDDAFLTGTEFAHLHGRADGSLHLRLPESAAAEAVSAGWAEQHPMARAGVLPATLLMVYGPRDEDELEQVWQLVRTAYDYARGNARA